MTFGQHNTDCDRNYISPWEKKLFKTKDPVSCKSKFLAVLDKVQGIETNETAWHIKKYFLFLAFMAHIEENKTTLYQMEFNLN